MNIDILVFGKFNPCSQYLRIFGRPLQLKTTALLVFFTWLVNSLRNLKIISLLITFRNLFFFLISSMTSIFLIQLGFWTEFWHDLAHWHSSKFVALQSRCKCDQVSNLEQQLWAWSGLLISLLAKFNLFHLTSHMKQVVIDVKMNNSNFDEKSSYDTRVSFFL